MSVLEPQALSHKDAMADLEHKVDQLESNLAAFEKECARLDGQNAAFWQAQHEWSKKHDIDDTAFHLRLTDDVKALDNRVGSLEKTVAKYAAAAALLGGLAGAMVPYVIGLMMKS